jgi:hypothetical protein
VYQGSGILFERFYYFERLRTTGSPKESAYFLVDAQLHNSKKDLIAKISIRLGVDWKGLGIKVTVQGN